LLVGKQIPFTFKEEHRMPAISRRRFLRDASLGAAAVGTVAVAGPKVFGIGTASAQPAKSGGEAAAPLAAAHSRASTLPPGTEVMAHVVNDGSGTISIYSGTRKVTLRDQAVTETLLEALQ
jgi:hypothetical protein